MSTKVKGDAIKEGSIPLSALSNEVKDKIENAGGGADWSAAKGEVGYIKNKPFKFYDENTEVIIPNNFLKFEDFTYEEDENNNTITFTSKNTFSSEIADVFYKGRIDITDDYTLDGSFFIKANYVNGKYVIPAIVGDIILYNRYDEDTNAIRVVIEANIDEAVFARKIWVNDGISLNIETLPEMYLPNTVLKTTPQTLSDNAKNQALANLGIDNTKYILSVAPDNTFNIREFIDKFGFIAELNDDGYGGYIGDLIVTNKELFLDKVLCCGFNTSLAKCIYVNNSAEVVFFFEEGLAKGRVKVEFAENDMNSEPTMIVWEPLG